MKFTRDIPGLTTIRGVSESGFLIADDTLSGILLVTGEGLVNATLDKALDELLLDDFDPLLATEPEIVIIGSGSEALFTPRELMFGFARRGTGLEVMETRAAARTFNVLVSEGRRVAALMYPLT
ncbi:MAG: MTH938/NDUFAF3 family protein [Pseudomonadota bacterium]